MTRKAGRLVAVGALAAVSALLVAGAAAAHGGYHAGYGPGCGAGGGSAPAVGANVEDRSCGVGPGPGHGGPGMQRGMGSAGMSLLTDDERAAHRAKMQSLVSYDDCKAYVAEFSKQLQDRAKEKGQTVGGPNVTMCDRMKAHGRFVQ